MQGAAIVAIITAIGALVLAVSAFRSHRIGFNRGARMAAAWVGIIVGLVLLLKGFGL